VRNPESSARKRASKQPRPSARVAASGLGEDAGKRGRDRIEEALASLREKGNLHFYTAPARLNGLPTYFALLRRCLELRYDNPPQMVELALMAAVFAQGLDPERYSAAEIADYRCRAAVELGNAYRVADRLNEAGRMLGEATTFLEMGTGDPLLKARLFDVQASLLASRRFYAAACECLRLVRQIHLANGDVHLAGRALISQALYTIYYGRPAAAVDLLRQGMTEIDRERDATLYFVAIHNQAQCLIELGRYRQARTLLWQNERQDWDMGRVSLCKLSWLRSRIDIGLGQPQQAWKRLEQVRKEFREEGLLYKAALVTLELALLASQQGQAAETRRLALEAVQVFRSLSIAPESLGTVVLLQNAVEAQVDVHDLLEWILGFLRAAEQDASVSLLDWMRQLN
jgi:tetratricopeptide (TPR) repeat protein